MKIIKRVWSFYSVKLILALGLCALISFATKLTILSGVILSGLVIYFFVHSFRDAAFKKKKVVTKVFIYIFMVEFLLAGLASMADQSNNVSSSIRGQLSMGSSEVSK